MVKRARGRRFQIDDVVCNRKVIGIKAITDHLNDQKYEVEYLCCGKKGVLAHITLRKMASQNSTSVDCKECGRKKGALTLAKTQGRLTEDQKQDLQERGESKQQKDEHFDAHRLMSKSLRRA